MTSSSTSPAVPSPVPVLRLQHPGELLSALPYLIGFHPRDSLVVLAFGGPSGRRLELTQRVDLPAAEHAATVCAALARNVLLVPARGAAVLVVSTGPPPGDDAAAPESPPPGAELVAVARAELERRGVPVRTAAWAASTASGSPWACYDECRCRGALPDPGATPLPATAVAAGVLVHADRAELERLVVPVAAEVLRRRERLLTAAVDAASRAADTAPVGDEAAGRAVVEAALADTVAGRLHLDDDRVLALALALADPLVRDAALIRCAGPRAEAAEQLWAALARETPDPEAAEPAALLAACALLRGDGALAGIALDRAERAWPGHRLAGLLRAAWLAGMRPEQVRECLRTAPLPPAARARRRRRGRRR